MENRELKACPFCGEEPTMTTVGNTSSNYDVGFDFYVECYGCGISLPSQNNRKIKEALLFAAIS